MRIAEEKEIIELYHDNNIQNQDINNFWLDEDHFILKSTIKRNKYYEVCMTLCANTPVANHLKSKKLKEDWANSSYNYKYFENELEETAGGFFLYLKV